MKSQKICIIGDGLAGLTTALSLAKLNIEIDLFYTKKKLSYEKDTRTTAISKSNFNFIKKIISLKNNNLFWPSKNINLFYENNKGSLLRTLIYTIGHFAIAITVLMLIADVSFSIALTDAIVKPLANTVWYFLLDKFWASKVASK